MKSILLMSAIVLLTSQVFCQTKVLRGELTAFNTYPVANVKVSSKKAKSTVTTDSLGKFQIVCNEKDMLIVKSEVFTKLNLRIGKKMTFVKANLIFKNSPKNREIATGLGYMDADHLTYALAHLESENNDFCNYTDIFSMVKGKFPGVEVKNTPSGGPGIYVRGQKSLLGETEALYEIDGVIVNDVSFVVPCNMTSIDILKDGAAAIYGARGANGVVVIVTKANFEQ